jgi:hypothetical protein
MDLIERLFGISPDGGSGSLEFLLFLAPLIGVLELARRRSRARGDYERS